MKKLFSYSSLLFCFFSLLLGSCQREIPGAVIVDQAIFNLTASDSACAITPINGSFLEGKKLTGSENIQVEVMVSKTGAWSLATDSTNGFLFAGKGSFSDTGKQLVTLNAVGTPNIAGNFFFSVTTGLLKRFISIPVLKSNIPVDRVTAKSYFKGTIAGVQYYVEAPIQGPDNIPYGKGGGDTATFSSFLGPGIFPAPRGSGTISLQKQFMHNYFASTEPDFKNFFKPGAYAFTPNKCRTTRFHGIILFWSDSNGEGWTTSKEFTDQRGSSFVITDIEDGHNQKGLYYVKVRSRFNCKLYNIRTGSMIELTDGELVSYFIKPK